jgi:hypothetical protein
VVVLGVDTDGNGSLALLDTAAMTLDVYAVPSAKHVTGKTKSGKLRKRLKTTFCALPAICDDLSSHADVAYLELQWGWEGQAAGSSFTFGETFGVIKTSIASGFLHAGLSIEDTEEKIKFVRAEDWKDALHLGGDKAKAVALASQLFPFAAPAFERVSAAEAALIALYGATLSGVRFTQGSVFAARAVPYTDVTDSLLTRQE